MRKTDFKPGEYIIYVNGETYELGRIKRLKHDGAFVFYHGGDTPAGTCFGNMHKLVNAYCITETIFPYEELEENKLGLREEIGLCEKAMQSICATDPESYDYVMELLKQRVHELNSPQVTNYCPVCAERARKDEE